MYTLNFTLSLEGVVRIHDAVLCLAKFSEMVSLEARKDKVCGGFMFDRAFEHRSNIITARSHCFKLLKISLCVLFP